MCGKLSLFQMLMGTAYSAGAAIWGVNDFVASAMLPCLISKLLSKSFNL